MPDIRIGDPFPWEPLPPGEEVVPGREEINRRDLERAIQFPSSPDPDVMAEIETAAAGRGGSGRLPRRNGLSDVGRLTSPRHSTTPTPDDTK